MSEQRQICGAIGLNVNSMVTGAVCGLVMCTGAVAADSGAATLAFRPAQERQAHVSAAASMAPANTEYSAALALRPTVERTARTLNRSFPPHSGAEANTVAFRPALDSLHVGPVTGGTAVAQGTGR